MRRDFRFLKVAACPDSIESRKAHKARLALARNQDPYQRKSAGKSGFTGLPAMVYDTQD